MKKILLTLITGMFISSLAFAAGADLFTYDAHQVDQEMAQLQTLEDFVVVNPGVTLTGLQQEENSLLADLNLSTYANGGIAAFSGEPALGIPSFLWGCILGPVGILIVYLVSEDGDETKKALFGCLAWGGAWTIFYVIRYIFWYVV